VVCTAAAAPGQRLQCCLDLAEFDASAAELDLVVGPALKDESGALEAHEVSAAVGALPAETRHRRVLLGVLDRVEVARESDASDDQLPDLALADRLPGGVDHGEVPAVERNSDAHGG
jgi:hypothetical protein